MPIKIKKSATLAPVRHIRISDEVHKKIRKLAIDRGQSIGQVIADAFKTL